MYKHSEQLRCKNIARNRTYAEQFVREQRSFVDAFIDFAGSFRSRPPQAISSHGSFGQLRDMKVISGNGIG